MMKNETIKISGMSCSHCQAAVERALKELPGMRKVYVSLDEGQAVLTYEENELSMEAIKNAIEDAGYEVV